MAISVNWATKVIFVPQADLTFITGLTYELDIDVLRLALKVIEADEGIWEVDTHSHNTEVVLGNLTLARVVQIINGFTVEFEDGAYLVDMVGANSNILDVVVHNQVSVRANNSAGLIITKTSGLTALETAQLQLITDLLQNKLITDPTTGILTIYEADGSTPLLTAQLYEDADGTQTYRGQGSERRERLL
jgi:hypothetical protein